MTLKVALRGLMLLHVKVANPNSWATAVLFRSYFFRCARVKIAAQDCGVRVQSGECDVEHWVCC